jgi:branched-chain amino acid transport system ATP-binding protein
MPPVLSVRGLRKRFGGIVVADDLAIDIGPGEIVGLIGPNGAGKTSFFNLATGFVRADSGEVLLDGRRIDRAPAYRRAKLGLARTWQNARLFPSLTVLDNVLVGARTYPGERLWMLLARPGHVGRVMAENRERALTLLGRVKLDGKAGVLATELSYGQQKLVALTRSLMNGGRCLLLDEPMAGVEGRTYEIMADAIRTEAADGTAICLVEHNVGFVRELCSRGVFMVSGRVIAEGSIEEIVSNPALTQLYFGE